MGHFVLNGLLPEGYQSVSFFSSSAYDEIWMEAEQKTAELLGQIQPSKPSEERRRAVIDYVERLIEREFNCKVFPFGSVPLKTYLPDGDIDLTAISELHQFNDTWANDVSAILEHEERGHNSEFHVKEVKCIHAEVPVVKCLVENIIVDISFNQLGGLSTLCFLEEIDRLIGRDHLFKRSIILVKAWCFYESRILGAHHGLLSTYALEVLVLYVFHVFHRSLRGPLEVLFRFLQFFSKFDWKQYCLSLWGPIPLVSLHTMAAEPPQNPTGSLLLSEEYLNTSRIKYGTLLEGTQGKTFSQKFMNLVDPLRPFNNLGRSVNKGNFARIYSAFTFGAGQLEKLLQGPKENFPESLATFFRNTQSHRQGHRPDAGVQGYGINVSLRNGKARSNKDATSNMITVAGEIMDVTTSEQVRADQTYGACLDKPSHDTDVSIHLQGDAASQCSAGAKLCTTAMVSDNDDYRACNCVCDGDFLVGLSDEANMQSRRVKSEDFDIDTYEKKIADLTVFSETSLVHDLVPKNKSPSVDAEDLVSYENICCDHGSLNNLKTKTQSEEDQSSSPVITPSMVSVHSSEVGACKSGQGTPCKDQMTEEEAQNDKMQAYIFGGDLKDQMTEEEAQNNEMQAYIFGGDLKDQTTEEEAQNGEMQAYILGGDLTSQLQISEVRDTDADILEGDYTIHLQNLEAGRFYQNSHMHGNNPYAFNIFHPKHFQQGSAWEGPGRPVAMNLDHFAQSTSGRNGVPPVSPHGGSPQDRCAVPNGILAEGFSKHQKGTGTFFPNMKPSFERDKRLLTNGIKGPRRAINGMDSFGSASHNGAPAYRSRLHIPKKRDGFYKLRTRKSPDLKAGEQDWDLVREEEVLVNVLHSPTTNVVDNFVHPFGVSGDPRINMIDWSPRSSSAAMLLPSGNSKDLPIEKLEFGSFGPGFLARGLQDVSANKDSVGFVLQTEHHSPCGDSLEPSEVVSKAGHCVDQHQSAQSSYQLKEEDFPPLPFCNQRESPNAFADQKSTTTTTKGSYHQACLVGHLS